MISSITFTNKDIYVLLKPWILTMLNLDNLWTLVLLFNLLKIKPATYIVYNTKLTQRSVQNSQPNRQNLRQRERERERLTYDVIRVKTTHDHMATTSPKSISSLSAPRWWNGGFHSSSSSCTLVPIWSIECKPIVWPVGSRWKAI